MEFIFELLFELFGEIILQIVFEALAEAGLHIFRKPRADAPPASAWRRAIGYPLLGLIVGAISLLVFPHSMMHSRAGRITSLVLSPVAAGLAMAIIGALRQRRGQQVLGLDRFAYGYLFALAMAVVRFMWAQ